MTPTHEQRPPDEFNRLKQEQDSDHHEAPTTNLQVVAHPRLKRDYTGKRVRTVRELTNGWGTIPAGSVAMIDVQSPKGSKLVFEQCTCCGMKAIVSHVSASDIEFVEEAAQ